jgi:hypothetical protein
MLLPATALFRAWNMERWACGVQGKWEKNKYIGSSGVKMGKVSLEGDRA